MSDRRHDLLHPRPVRIDYWSGADQGAAGHEPSCPPAIHEHAACAYFTRGRAVFEQRERFEVRAGDVVLVPAGEAHRTQPLDDAAWWGIGFCAPCLAPTELARLLDPFERARAGASAVVRIPEARRAQMAHLCAELAREAGAQGPAQAHGELVTRSLFALVLAEIARAAGTAPASDVQPDLVREALRYIELRCLEPISLREVAAAVGRSPSYLTATVKRATGRSVVEWIIAGRLSEARNRLLHTDEMVEIIAERVGYADATHFIRLFRRTHGVTPAAWRAAQRRALAQGSAPATASSETSE